MGLTPVYKVEANGTDVTEQLRANSASISFHDEDGNQADEITISIAGAFKRPKYEDEIKLWLGYKEETLFYCGLFLVQTTQRDAFSLTITATGTDFSLALKQKRDEAYEQVSLQEVANTVAMRHGLKLKSDFSDLYVTHLAQTHESDLNLMRRLAEDYNGIFSVKNGTLVFLKRYKGGKRSDVLPVFTIDTAECSQYSVKHANKTLYNSCVASWHNTKENEAKSVKVGNGDPVLQLSGQFKTAAEAQAKAEAKLQRSKRGTKSGSLTTYGREIYAGGTLNLSGAKEDSGEYSIKSVEHTFDGGWSIAVEFEN